MYQKYQSAGYLEENYHFFHLRDTAGQELDFHFHDFDKLVILIEGRVNYLVENENYPLKPHDILLIRHHCIHKALIDRREPYERIIVYLDRLFFGRTLPEAHLMDCFDRADTDGRHLLVPDREQWSDISRIVRLFESDPSQAMRDTLMLQLMIVVGRIPLSEAAPTEQPDPKIREILLYIDENLSGDLSVDTLSARLWLSRYHFMHLFKAQTGHSVHAYVREKRLLCAARMIREGVSASKAASACGFQDYSSFHRAFVSSFGCTPGKIKTDRKN